MQVSSLYSEVMGILYRSDPAKYFMVVLWDGVFSWDEWQAHIRLAMADPDWANPPRILSDLRSVTDTATIQEPEMRQALAQLGANQHLLAGRRNAIVAGAEFRKASRYAELVEHYGMQTVVFNNLDTACIFLNINPEYARAKIAELHRELKNIP